VTEQGAWSYAAEAQQSLLFGYTKKQRAEWLAWHRSRDTGFGSTAVYALLTEAQYERVMSVGKRCFGQTGDVAGMTFFFSRQRDAIKKTATRLMPEGTVLARVGLDLRTLEAVFRHRDTWARRNIISATVTRTTASTLNANLRSNVQFLTARGWN